MTAKTKHGHDSSRSDGFTIIEVLVVLAIAGVIMLIVFQAIPALSRNSRNNQRKQDVSAVLEAVSRYELNNSAVFPSSVPTLAISSNNLLQYSKLSYYSPANIIVESIPASSGAVTKTAAGLTVDDVRVYDYQKCDPSNQGDSIGQGADYGSIVALYALESGSGTTPICQQL